MVPAGSGSAYPWRLQQSSSLMQKQNGRTRFKLTRTAALALLLSAAACATTRSSRGYAPFPAEIAPLYASQAPEAKPHGDSAGFHPHSAVQSRQRTR